MYRLEYRNRMCGTNQKCDRGITTGKYKNKKARRGNKKTSDQIIKSNTRIRPVNEFKRK